MDSIDKALAAADRAWQAYGVAPADRATLAADLRHDLQAAAADGVGPERLLGPDVADFACRLADEAAVQRVPPERERLLGTALAGAAAGAAIGYLLLAAAYPQFLRAIDVPSSARLPVQVAVGLYYGVPAALIVAGAVAAVRVGLRDLPRIRATAWGMGLLLPAAGIVITPITMAFAWSTGYSTAPLVVLTEIAMVLAAVVGATVLARRWALRDRTVVGRPRASDAGITPA